MCFINCKLQVDVGKQYSESLFYDHALTSSVFSWLENIIWRVWRSSRSRRSGKSSIVPNGFICRADGAFFIVTGLGTSLQDDQCATDCFFLYVKIYRIRVIRYFSKVRLRSWQCYRCCPRYHQALLHHQLLLYHQCLGEHFRPVHRKYLCQHLETRLARALIDIAERIRGFASLSTKSSMSFIVKEFSDINQRAAHPLLFTAHEFR